MFKITSRKEKNLREKMRRYGVKGSDLLERFIRAGGRGGQKLNKTSVCVYLKHLPTGTEVKCARERSRAANRYLARKILVGKIEKSFREKAERKRSASEKEKRRNRKRPKRVKEKMLAEKKKRGLKKRLRRPVDPEKEH